jgi:hypothetical protein
MCCSAPLAHPLPSLLKMKTTRMPTVVLPALDQSSVMYLTCEDSSIVVVSGLVKNYAARAAAPNMFKNSSCIRTCWDLQPTILHVQVPRDLLDKLDFQKMFPPSSSRRLQIGNRVYSSTLFLLMFIGVGKLLWENLHTEIFTFSGTFLSHIFFH